MKTIELSVHGIQVTFDTDNPGGGSVVCNPNLYDLCPHCSSKDCFFQCGQSPGDDRGAVVSRFQFNGAVNGILSMILAHAVSGIDIDTPAYEEGIDTALQAAGENL